MKDSQTTREALNVALKEAQAWKTAALAVNAERDALAAQVESIKEEFHDAKRTLSTIASCGLDSTDTEIADVALSEARLWVARYDDSVLKKTPQQCLADAKAEAIESLLPKCIFSEDHKVKIITEDMVRYNAEQIRQDGLK